jgi:hypothetical protein
MPTEKDCAAKLLGAEFMGYGIEVFMLKDKSTTYTAYIGGKPAQTFGPFIYEMYVKDGISPLSPVFEFETDERYPFNFKLTFPAALELLKKHWQDRVTVLGKEQDL